MYHYKFIGFRKNKSDIFYIDGVNISDKTWFSTGRCVTVKGNKNNDYHLASEYYAKIEDKQKLYFAVLNTEENKEAIYIRVSNGVN